MVGTKPTIDVCGAGTPYLQAGCPTSSTFLDFSLYSSGCCKMFAQEEEEGEELLQSNILFKKKGELASIPEDGMLGKK